MKINITNYEDFYHVSIKPFTDEMQSWIEKQFSKEDWWIAGGLQLFGETWICMKNNKDVTAFILRWS